MCLKISIVQDNFFSKETLGYLFHGHRVTIGSDKIRNTIKELTLYVQQSNTNGDLLGCSYRG